MIRRSDVLDSHKAMTMLPRLEAGAERGYSVTFLDPDPPETVTWLELCEDARAVAAAFQARGVRPGDRVALLGPTSRALVTAITAVWYAGCTVSVLPLRTRLTPGEDFVEQTRARIGVTDAVLTVTEPELAAGLDESKTITFDTLLAEAASLGTGRYERVPDGPDDVAIVQFTSGSTSDPKGVMIPHGCLLTNLDATNERLPIDRDDDVMMTWCPLYHDMGLVALLARAMSCGTELVLSTPQYFVAKPRRWMEAMSFYRGTSSVAPNFAFALSTRLLPLGDGLDLSWAKALGSASEPIDPAVMDAFAPRATQQGLRLESLYGAYGMAESTAFITLQQEGTGFEVDVVDGETLERERRAEPLPPDHSRARALARCGQPVTGSEVRIADAETGTVLGERGLGELEVRGPSVVPGYFRRPDATAEAFRDGWLRTGDLGYFADGDIVICGRLKDVILVAGRNIFPQDMEWAASKVGGVRPGNVIAFGIESRRDREEVVVVAEVKVDEGHQRVRRDVARSVGAAVGVRPTDVVLVRQGSLPKTSSGKLRRSLCRTNYLLSQLERA